jgi:hypothetical protein
MAVGLQKTGKRILGHPRKKEVTRLLTTDQISTTREVASQVKVVVTAEAHSSLCTACTMEMILTIAQKTTQYSSNPRERWSKTPTSLHNNLYLEK